MADVVGNEEQHRSRRRRRPEEGPSSPPTSLQWMDQASDAARVIVTSWIRSVFREVCRQVIKECWLNNRSRRTTLEPNEFVVTHDDLQVCQNVCERLGIRWATKLRQRQGQTHVAQWVDQVVASKSYWLDEATQDHNNEQMDDSTAIHENETNRQPQQQEEEQQPTQIQHDPSSSGSNEASTATTKISTTRALARLQQLGKQKIPPDDDNEDQIMTEAQVIQALDQMGRNGQTLWPRDWQLVQDMVDENFKRLHSETLTGRPRPIRMMKQLLPKEEQNEEEHNNNNDNNNNITEEEEDDDSVPVMVSQDEMDRLPVAIQRAIMMKKKRKETAALIQNDGDGRALMPPPPKKGRYASSSDTLANVAARKPSPLGPEEKWSFEHDVLTSLSQEERTKLEQSMLHCEEEEKDDHDNNSSDDDIHGNDNNNNTVLGALKNLGHVHLCLQKCHDAAARKTVAAEGGSSSDVVGIEDDDEDTQNQKRTTEALRKAQKERLGPHRREADRSMQRTNRRWTKIIRAVPKKKKNDDDKDERWMELDLGECLVQVTPLVDGGGEPRLCAFSSLEVSLKEGDDDNTAFSTQTLSSLET